jgi:glycine betaine/proline transport system ATP-binding protein
MEGGRIVQCGTPQEIFTNPATGYVADFVAHMNPLGVLVARDMMEPVSGPPAAAPDRTVPPEATIRQVMAAARDHDAPVGVVGNGQLLGQITRNRILSKLLDPRT